MGKIILAGGSGYLGQSLGRRLVAEGREVVVLTRHPRPESLFREVAWDGATSGAWASELNGAEALVNLAGRSINCVHNAENKRLILESRVNSVRALGAALAGCRRPPPVWVQCSAVGLYGNAGERACTEEAPAGNDFMAQVCRQWEAELLAVPVQATRKVRLRLGIVLGPNGGALQPLARLTRCFLGGRAGNGRQYVSWIHQEDLNEIFRQAIMRSDFTEAYNACAPNPVTNADFMRTLRGALGRPWSPPAPAWAVRFAARFILRTDPDLALHGQRAVPARLLAQGFAFKYPELGAALREILVG